MKMINATLYENNLLRDKVKDLREQIRVYEGDSLNTQSKLESRVEMFANYTSGFLIAWFTWTILVMGPFTWGWIDKNDGFAITMIFTTVSILRSYYWRRFFARGFHNVVNVFVRRNIGW